MGGCVLTAVGPLDRAGPGTLTLAVSPRYADALAGLPRRGRAGAAGPGEDRPPGPAARIVVRRSRTAPWCSVIRRLFPAPTAPLPGIDPTARIGPGCRLGADVTHRPFRRCSGGACSLGDRCRLAEGVSLGDGVVVGEDSRMDARVVCYAGARIGRRVVLKAGRGDRGRRVRVSFPRLGARADSPRGRLHHRGRRGDRLQLLRGPRQPRRHRDRAGHQARQPGSRGAQRADRRALPADGRRGGRGEHPAGQRRDPRGPRRRHRPSHDRRPGAGRGQERGDRQRAGGLGAERESGAAQPAGAAGPGGAVPSGADRRRAREPWWRRDDGMPRRTLARRSHHRGRRPPHRRAGDRAVRAPPSRGRASSSGGWISPARRRCPRGSPTSAPPIGAPRWASRPAPSRRWSTCSPRPPRSSSTT